MSQQFKQKNHNLTPKNQNVKKELQSIIKDISFIFRKNGLTYEQTKYVVRESRMNCELAPNDEKNKKYLPIIPSKNDIDKILSLSEKKPTHWLIIKLLVVSGLRISELIGIKKDDIYLNELKIFISESKTGNRYVLFPESLKIHIINEMQKTDKGIKYVFVSRLFKPYTRQGIWFFIKQYAKEAGIEKKLHPHLFRHWWITEMAKVLPEKGLEVLSGNKDNLDRYIHLNVDSFKTIYQNTFL